jgi:hypothetical protein
MGPDHKDQREMVTCPISFIGSWISIIKRGTSFESTGWYVRNGFRCFGSTLLRRHALINLANIYHARGVRHNRLPPFDFLHSFFLFFLGGLSLDASGLCLSGLQMSLHFA